MRPRTATCGQERLSVYGNDRGRRRAAPIRCSDTCRTTSAVSVPRIEPTMPTATSEWPVRSVLGITHATSWVHVNMRSSRRRRSRAENTANLDDRAAMVQSRRCLPPVRATDEQWQEAGQDTKAHAVKRRVEQGRASKGPQAKVCGGQVEDQSAQSAQSGGPPGRGDSVLVRVPAHLLDCQTDKVWLKRRSVQRKRPTCQRNEQMSRASQPA